MKKRKKKAGVVAQDVGPEFKTQSTKKKKKRKRKNSKMNWRCGSSGRTLALQA
jgi:hypothetical protein